MDDDAAYTSFPEEFPHAEFFRFFPAPVGPYLIRQELAERSPEPLLTLQDSDDLSCYDRFTSLSAALAETGSDIIGSHELCLDELRALVQPVRFPLDSSASLNLCANHALLHATLMCHRDAYFRAGGLATNLIIASDSQFLLRAWFTARIRNVDEFLYIRRRHATSLTNAPETVYDNPLRRRLSADWTRDFDAVKRGELRLEASSLWPARREWRHLRSDCLKARGFEQRRLRPDREGAGKIETVFRPAPRLIGKIFIVHHLQPASRFRDLHDRALLV